CLLPHFSGQPMDTAQVEQLLGKLMPALGHLDQELLATRPFLASGQVSLADLMAFTELMQPSAFSCDLFQDWPWPATRRPIGMCFSLGTPRKPSTTAQMAQKLVQRVKEQLR
ncbi:GSTT1, partial [Cervus elaphus hippelaphus]